jgi:hypothetical protein
MLNQKGIIYCVRSFSWHPRFIGFTGSVPSIFARPLIYLFVLVAVMFGCKTIQRVPCAPESSFGDGCGANILFCGTLGCLSPFFFPNRSVCVLFRIFYGLLASLAGEKMIDATAAGAAKQPDPAVTYLSPQKLQ